MEKATKIEKEMMTYIFKVVIEEDPFPDGQMAYYIYCPALTDYAASTWGHTKEEAIRNIHEVIQMIIEELIEDGKSIPEFSKEDTNHVLSFLDDCDRVAEQIDGDFDSAEDLRQIRNERVSMLI